MTGDTLIFLPYLDRYTALHDALEARLAQHAVDEDIVGLLVPRHHDAFLTAVAVDAVRRVIYARKTETTPGLVWLAAVW